MAEFKRMDGDAEVAARLAAAVSLLRDAKADLRNGLPVGAMDYLARGELVLNLALADLERVTAVPWTALMHDPLYASKGDA